MEFEWIDIDIRQTYLKILVKIVHAIEWMPIVKYMFCLFSEPFVITFHICASKFFFFCFCLVVTPKNRIPKAVQGKTREKKKRTPSPDHFIIIAFCRRMSCAEFSSTELFFMRIEYMNYYYGRFFLSAPKKKEAQPNKTMRTIEIHLQAATTPSTIEVAQHQSRLKRTKKKKNAVNDTHKKIFTLETYIKRSKQKERTKKKNLTIIVCTSMRRKKKNTSRTTRERTFQNGNNFSASHVGKWKVWHCEWPFNNARR